MSVQVYHLNCGTMRPYGLFPFSTMPLNGTGKWFRKGLGVIHCLLVDSGAGLILVDTGYGTQDYTQPTPLVRNFNQVIGLKGDLEQTALLQIISMGYDPDEVKHIFLTHMHLDHTGGLPDFPHAKVHVLGAEYEMAINGQGFESRFFIDQHWAHGPDWQVHRTSGETWCRLACTSRVAIGDVEAFLVPTVGHSPGHSLVALGLPGERWIIHAGDSYGYHGQIDPQGPFYPPFQWLFRPLFNTYSVTRAMFQHDSLLRRLRVELGDKLTIFCAHDPHEFESLSGETVL